MNTATDTNSSKKTISLKTPLKKLLAIARQKDTPHRIALGLALGIFVGILPIMGIQMTVVTLFALPFRANLKAAVAGVWISNPLTFIPMYFGYYKFGLLFFPAREVSWQAFMQMITDAGELNWSAPGESLYRIMDIGADILVPMWAGASVLAIFFAVISYFITRRIVVSYRNSRGNKQATPTLPQNAF